jgi:probable HAF family extracellular repeat protein
MRFVTVGFSGLLLACFAVGIVPAQATNYVVQDLGLGCATGINSSGQVVGCTGAYTSFLDDYNSWATGGWLYSGGTRTDLGSTISNGFGYQCVTASGINNSGQISGTMMDTGSYFQTTYTYLIHTDGTPYNLGATFPSGTNTQGINSLGQVCGYVKVDPMFSSVGHLEFIYTPTFAPDGFGGTILSGVTGQDYGFNGNLEATARGINDNGQVTGQVQGQAIRFDSGISYVYYLGTDIDPNFNFANSEGRAINNSSQMCGWAIGSDGKYHPFLCTPGAPTPTVDLGLVHGGDSCANAINNNGQAVGESFNAAGADPHAFVYDGSATADLNSLIGPNSGWTLTTALGINDSGDIVGGGIFGGQMHAFLLTPEAGPHPGDANSDGAVNIQDLSVVLANYDKTGMSWSQGDFTGDGTVNIGDLSIILANYDKTFAAGHINVVPEPSTLLLAIGALLSVLAYAWRKQR